MKFLNLSFGNLKDVVYDSRVQKKLIRDYRMSQRYLRREMLSREVDNKAI